MCLNMINELKCSPIYSTGPVVLHQYSISCVCCTHMYNMFYLKLFSIKLTSRCKLWQILPTWQGISEPVSALLLWGTTPMSVQECMALPKISSSSNVAFCSNTGTHETCGNLRFLWTNLTWLLCGIFWLNTKHNFAYIAAHAARAHKIWWKLNYMLDGCFIFAS